MTDRDHCQPRENLKDDRGSYGSALPSQRNIRSRGLFSFFSIFESCVRSLKVLSDAAIFRRRLAGQYRSNGADFIDNEIEESAHTRRLFHVLMHEQVKMRGQFWNRAKHAHQVIFIVAEDNG